MACNCRERIENKLREKYDDPEIQFDGIVIFPDGKFMHYITYQCRNKKKDGSFTKPKERKFLLDKCPFCGEKMP